jgi:hypothetical protein
MPLSGWLTGSPTASSAVRIWTGVHDRDRGDRYRLTKDAQVQSRAFYAVARLDGEIDERCRTSLENAYAIDPLAEQRHRKTLSVPFGHRLLFVPKQRPSIILRAARGAQAILSPMPQGVDYLVGVIDAAIVQKPVKSL